MTDYRIVARVKALKRKIWRKSGGKCFYCGVEMHRHGVKDDTKFTVEHLVPKSKGGKLQPSNCVGACFKCNTERAAKSIYEFVNGKKVEKKYCICENPIIKRVKNLYYMCIVCAAEYKYD